MQSFVNCVVEQRALLFEAYLRIEYQNHLQPVALAMYLPSLQLFIS